MELELGKVVGGGEISTQIALKVIERSWVFALRNREAFGKFKQKRSWVCLLRAVLAPARLAA